MYTESPLPFVFGVVCKTPLFWVLSILFGVVSCKKGLLSSKQLVGIHYALSSWIMWAFCVFPVWCWISHPYTAVRPRRMTKTACLNNFGSTVPVAIQNVCLLLKVSCRGKYVHIATLLQKIHGFEHIGGLDLLVPTHCWNSFDWWTDGRVKKGTLFQKKSFGSGRVQTGRIFPYFGRIFPYFRTPSRRPSAKKVLLKKKRPLYVCIVWADLPRQNVPSKLSNAPVCLQHSATECWDLTPMHAKWKSKARPKIKARKMETMASILWFFSTCSINQPKSKWHLQKWIASWECGMFIWFPQLQDYLHE